MAVGHSLSPAGAQELMGEENKQLQSWEIPKHWSEQQAQNVPGTQERWEKQRWSQGALHTQRKAEKNEAKSTSKH